MVKARPPLVPLLDALNDLTEWLAATKTPGAVIGGVAASLLGRPRVTRDVDVLVRVSETAWSRFMRTGARFGFVPRRSDAINFAHTTRVLLVRHEPSDVDIDVVFTALPFEDEVIARVRFIKIRNVRIPLATPEDLIIMKAVAGRARDIADIEALVTANPTLDRHRVRRWVREFSRALGRPQIHETLANLLQPKRRQLNKSPKRKHRQSTRRSKR